MLKKLFFAVCLPALLLTGCTATFTNLTPHTQVRNPENQYPVEVAFTSRQQTLRWNSINPQIVVGNNFYPMRPTLMMTNRWEGVVPVPEGVNTVHYHYKFDFLDNAMGSPRRDSASSPEYRLHIIDK